MKSTALALAECKRRGWKVRDVVERRVFGHTTRDFLGVIDIIVLDGLPGSLGIQACKADVRGHLRKLEESSNAWAWLRAGNRLEVWAFRTLVLAPERGVKRDGTRATKIRMRRLVAESAPGGIAWSEEANDV